MQTDRDQQRSIGTPRFPSAEWLLDNAVDFRAAQGILYHHSHLRQASVERLLLRQFPAGKRIDRCRHRHPGRMVALIAGISPYIHGFSAETGARHPPPTACHTACPPPSRPERPCAVSSRPRQCFSPYGVSSCRCSGSVTVWHPGDAESGVPCHLASR